MLKNLPLLIVIILSIFLAFYCVEFHKDTILSILKIEESRTTQPILEDDNKVVAVETEVVDVVENNTVGREIKNGVTEKSLYVETLAMDGEKNETIAEIEVVPEKVTPKMETLIIEEKKEVVEDMSVVIENVKKVEPDVREHREISESTKGYELDDLEKMILEELKNGEEK